MAPPPSRSVPRIARYTWSRQWPAAVFEGLSQGVIGLSFFAASRSLGSPEWIVPLLIGLWQLPWILSPAIGTILARSDPQRLWRRFAVIAHLPILFVAFVAVYPTGEDGHGLGNVPLFVALLFLYYGAGVVYVPHRGAMLRTNYPLAVRGRYFGLLTALAFLANGLAQKAGGFLLDHDPRWLRGIFPVAAALGTAGFLVQGRVRWRGQRRPRPDAGERLRASVGRAWREAFGVLRSDRDFLVYEAAFMLYGFGFLASIGLNVLYADKVLNLSWNQWTWAAGIAFPLAQIVAAAPAGRLADRFGVIRTTAGSFAVLALFFGSMCLVRGPLSLVAAYALFGVGMAGVMVGWSLGPLRFAPEGKGHMYSAIHFSMVGVRSAIAPFLGFAMKEWISFRAAFLLSVGFQLAAMVVLGRLAGRVDRGGMLAGS